MQPNLTNIFLVGFMGTGTTTVGGLLAKKLDWRFLDTDQMVVKISGNPIARMMETEGEAAFRSAEAQQVAVATTGKRTVVSLGGGALLDRDNRERVLRSGMVVFLEASVDTLLTRTGGSQRPLLRPQKGKTLRQTIEDLLAARKYIYDQAHLTVATDGKTPEAVMLEIIKGAEAWKG
jgi:shikimate kinase